MKWKKITICLLPLIIGTCIFFTSGCGRKRIEGVVQDVFGEGVESVSVQIVKTKITALTDKDGKYSIDYVPGNFTVKFSKNGYTTHNLDLVIQQKMRFPAESIIMFPIPKNQGIYYLGEKELIQMSPRSVSGGPSRISGESHWKYYTNLSGKILTIKKGEAKFIDTSPKDERFARLKGEGVDGLIQHLKSGFFGREYVYKGFQEDEKLERIGEEKLLVRTVLLEPGVFYAWVEVIKDQWGVSLPDKKLACYPIRVVADNLEISLANLRSAISIYYGMNEGVFPESLKELVPECIIEIPEGDWEYNPKTGSIK